MFVRWNSSRNETEPGVLVGGGSIWCMTVAIGYLLEPFILLALFGKKSLSITLKGITNDSNDHSVDTFRTTTLHMLKRFGIPSEGLELKIVNWGALPLGGEIFLGVPTAPNTLTASHWVDEGMVQSIRGVTFSTRVSPQIGSRMIYAARGVFNHFMPDVHIFTDYRSGPSGGRSPVYGVSLVVETTTGFLNSPDIAISHPKHEEMNIDPV